MISAQRAVVVIILFFSIHCALKGQSVSYRTEGKGTRRTYTLANDQIE
jgi:hypothetical protein